jgi:maleylacetate reductase
VELEFSRQSPEGTLVVFGRPWRSVLPTMVENAATVAIVCSTRGSRDAAEIARVIGARRALVVPLARQHVPREVVADAEHELARAAVDTVVAFGGGSAIGLVKALKLDHDLRAVALPTTYAGSEMTSIYGIRESGQKRVGRSDRVRLNAVLYDPELTLDLPVATSITSLFNAMAHAVDALYASDRPAELEVLAAEAIREVAGAMEAIVSAPRDLEVRRRAQYGAHLGARILGTAGMALHHKLAHILGGTFDLPHAETHTVILPHVVAFNAEVAPAATKVIADALGSDEPAASLFDLAQQLGAPTRLDALGLTARGASQAAAALASQPYDNPRHATLEEAQALVTAALTGARPRPALYAPTG